MKLKSYLWLLADMVQVAGFGKVSRVEVLRKVGFEVVLTLV